MCRTGILLIFCRQTLQGFRQCDACSVKPKTLSAVRILVSNSRMRHPMCLCHQSCGDACHEFNLHYSGSWQFQLLWLVILFLSKRLNSYSGERISQFPVYRHIQNEFAARQLRDIMRLGTHSAQAVRTRTLPCRGSGTSRTEEQHRPSRSHGGHKLHLRRSITMRTLTSSSNLQRVHVAQDCHVQFPNKAPTFTNTSNRTS